MFMNDDDWLVDWLMFGRFDGFFPNYTRENDVYLWATVIASDFSAYFTRSFYFFLILCQDTCCQYCSGFIVRLSKYSRLKVHTHRNSKTNNLRFVHELVIILKEYCTSILIYAQ